MSEKLQDKPLISLIVPVYNRAETLPRLFYSLSKITFSSLEIILVDNCSKDQSLQLCRDFQISEKQRKGLNVILSVETKKGACACRNHGLNIAQGDFVYFFDSDDEISPDFFSDLAPYCDNYDAICAPTRMQFENGQTKVRSCIPTTHPYDQILSASISTQSLLIRKSLLLAIGGWDENLFRWNDWELGVRLLCYQPNLLWIKGKAYHTIYQHEHSISGKSFADDYEKLIKTLEKAASDIEGAALKSSIKIKSFNALAAKCLLLSSNLNKEGNIKLSKAAFTLANEYAATPGFKVAAARIFTLAQHNIPGTWRLYRWFV